MRSSGAWVLRWVLMLPALGVGLSAVSSGAAPEETAIDSLRAVPTLRSETTELRPGTTTWFALDFVLDPDWHMYWNGRNDSGLPPVVTAHLPAGFEMGPVEWPAPSRHVAPGGIVDHVYWERATLLFPIRVAENVASAGAAGGPVGGEVELAFEVDWLVCHEMCIPERRTVRMRLPVRRGDGAPPLGPDAPLFAAARERLPLPTSEAGRALRFRWDESALTLLFSGAERLAFYPDTSCVELVDLATTTEANGDGLRLTPAEPGAGGRVSGVLSATVGPRTRYFQFVSPVAPARR